MLALLRAKFACNLVISNPVFRWESCKGTVRENVKKCSKLYSEAAMQLDLVGGLRLASCQKMHMSEACKEAEPSCQL